MNPLQRREREARENDQQGEPGGFEGNEQPALLDEFAEADVGDPATEVRIGNHAATLIAKRVKFDIPICSRVSEAIPRRARRAGPPPA